MEPINFNLLSDTEKEKFIKNIDTVLTDCDGVIWIGKKVIPGAPDLLNLFQSKGRRVFFISNNSTKTVPEYIAKFSKMGFNIQKEHIIVTAPLAGTYLDEHLDKSKSAYVIGSPALCSELKDRNIKCFGVGPEPTVENLSDGDGLEQIELKENVGVVLVGYDLHINYIKMLKAASYLNDPQCLFVATNSDSRFPSNSPKHILPGTGTIVSAIECCSGRKSTILGKPNEYLGTFLKQNHNINPDRTLMIGDRCNTDILFGRRNGFHTLLVLTGTHSLSDVEEYKQSDNYDDQNSVPEYYTDSLADLLPTLTRQCDK